eukprot:6109113-Alexandrium_andersonii.AAC.1
MVSSQAPAPPGRAPGPQDDRRPAGVALIVPPPWELLEQYRDAAGLVAAALFAHPEHGRVAL